MTRITLQLPDDLAASLSILAAEQAKTLEELALDKLRFLVDPLPGTPAALLRAMRSSSPASEEDVDEMLAAIRCHGMCSTHGVFDDLIRER